MSKEDKFSTNALMNVLAWAVSAIAAFVCVPVTVRGLGADAYGLIALIGALTGYLGLLDIGLNQALVRYLSFYRELDQGRPMIAIVRVASVWFAGAGIVAAVALIMSAPWLARHAFHVAPDLFAGSVTVIRLSAINLVLGLLVSVGMAVPVSFLRYDIASGISGVFGVAAYVGPAVLVTMGRGIVAITLFYTASNVLSLLLYVCVGRHLLGSVKRDIGPGWKDVRRSVLSFAGLIAVNRVGSTVAVQTNKLVLGIANSAAATAYYQVPDVITSRAWQLLNRIAGVLFPTSAALIARKDTEGLRALYLRSSRLLFLANASIAMPVAVYARPLLQYWVDPTYAEQGALAMMLLAAAMALNAAAMAVGYISWGAARAGINLVFASVGSVITLAAIYPLASRFGVPGAAAASLAGAFVQPLFVHYVNRRILGISSRMVFRHCYLPTIVGAGLAATGSCLVLIRFADSLPATAVLLVVTALLSVVISGLLGAITRGEIRQLRDRVLNMRAGRYRTRRG
ncbi:MAG: hypothetical protein GXX83_07295 [Gaiellales bacterium]|nr:hypothetical protein [Gaiellales bacterium]